jgi:multiple sugar transport system permease protein
MKNRAKIKLSNHKKNYINKNRKKELTAFYFLLPSLTGVVIFILLPFIDVVRRSFYEAMSGQFAGFANYNTVLNNEAFRLAAKNTGRFLAICIPLLLLLTLLLSLLMYQQKKHAQFFKTSFLLPMAIPVASIALLWKLLFDEQGLLNRFLLSAGGMKIDFLNTDKAFLILLITYLWKNMGYDMVLWLTGLNAIDAELYEAASVDGAGVLAKFKFITMPKLLPTVHVIVILSFVNSFKVFREAYLISGDYPQEKIYMLQHLFNNWFLSLDIQKMCAAAVMCVLLFLIIILLIIKLDKDEV